MSIIENFKGRIIENDIPCYKLGKGEEKRFLIIGDLHGYTNDFKRLIRLSKAIMQLNPDFIFIAGDIFNGSGPWNGGEKLKLFSLFLQTISEVAPVFITWGNHDTRGLNGTNKIDRLRIFHGLNDLRKGKVFALYREKVIKNGIEVIGFVPDNELIEGSILKGFSGMPIQLHGIAHDRYIKSFEEYASQNNLKFESPDNINVHLGHDPQLIAVSENGIGLGGLSNCDCFIGAHNHGGYEKILEPINEMVKRKNGFGLKSLMFDLGWTAMFWEVDKNGKMIWRSLWPPIWGQANLCRGISYFDDMAQQKIWQSPNNEFYENVAIGLNKQEWSLITKEDAWKRIIQDNLHYMPISEGISPCFDIPSEKTATINVVNLCGTNIQKKLTLY